MPSTSSCLGSYSSISESLRWTMKWSSWKSSKFVKILHLQVLRLLHAFIPRLGLYFVCRLLYQLILTSNTKVAVVPICDSFTQ